MVNENSNLPTFVDPTPPKPDGPFQIGDRVRFQMPGYWQEGVIIEDRGNLGVGGRRIYGLRVRQDEWNEIYTEIPAEWLELVEAAPPKEKPKRKTRRRP